MAEVDGGVSAAGLMADASLETVSDLLFEEARLLDERRFEAWLDLYTEDCVYWIPARWGQESRTDEVSLMNDDRMTLQTRIGRLMHPRAHGQLPPSRTVHVVTNIRLAGMIDGLVRVQSACQFHEFRAPDRTSLVALVEHRLRVVGGAVRIAWKRIDLIDCDQAHRSLQVPI
jgi:benzoate/toluate 1,2-dioxygenase beta subunit